MKFDNILANHLLYLASKSNSRRCLLEQAKIPYTVINQTANESSADDELDLNQKVQAIAIEKMDNAILPRGKNGQRIYVLTADTLVRSNSGEIHGKPSSRQDAIAKIKSLRLRDIVVSTGYCLDFKLFEDDNWQVSQRICEVVSASCVFDIPDQWIDAYLANSHALKAASGVVIEDFGMQFLKSINGSYSTILGLPLFQLRESLTKLKFLNKLV